MKIRLIYTAATHAAQAMDAKGQSINVKNSARLSVRKAYFN